MKKLIGIIACLFSITCFGQTKLISHRSHSGSNASFRTAVEHNLFDIGNSNFGLVEYYVDKIDTVIMKAGDKIIILRKQYRVVNGTARPATFTSDTLTKANAADFFSANNMDNLKAEIHKTYKNAVVDSTTRFIGFDKKFRQKQGALKK